MSRKRLTAYSYILIATAIWGIAGPLIKFGMFHIPPMIFLAYRFGISTLIAGIFFRKTLHVPKSSKQQWNIVLYTTLSILLGIGLLFIGFEKTSSLTGSLISATTPIFTAIAAYFFLKETITKREKIGTSIACAGAIITVIGPLIANPSTQSFGALEGNALILIAVMADAAGWLVGKYAIRSAISAISLTNISFLIGWVIFTLIAVYMYGPKEIWTILVSATIFDHAIVWFMALASGTIAYGLRNKAIQSIEISEASLFLYLTPVFAAPLAILWLQEGVSLWFAIGSGCIVIGVFLAEWKKKPPLTKRG